VTEPLREAGDHRRSLLAFAPYIAVSLLHLAMVAAGFDEGARLTKILLMPALALAVLLAMRPVRSAAAALLLLAIGFSWGGDASLTLPGDLWFVVGLASFLLAHVAYIALFLHLRSRGRRLPVWTLVYVAWFAVFLALLWSHLGGLLAPVAVYGLVLGAMAAFAGGNGGPIALGGALFVVSDSVLALGRFLPGYEFAPHDLVVMATYLGAQGLIAWGVVSARYEDSARARSSPALGRRASATAR
jgi:uncharacterized membrane protein YhhN